MRCLIQDIQIHSLNQCRLEGADPIKKILRHDIIPEKVELINQKKSPIQDDYIEKYLVEKDLNLTATLDAEAAYKDADFVVIAAPINYDSKKNFFDTSAVENVIELVIEYNTDAVMVIKSKLCLLNHQIIDEPLTAEEEMIALKNVLRGKRKFILTNIEARYVGYQKHNEEKAIEILDNVPKNFRDKQWYAVKRQLLENSIRKHSLAKRDILANEYTKELKKLDDVVEQKYGNINLREVDLLPDM